MSALAGAGVPHRGYERSEGRFGSDEDAWEPALLLSPEARPGWDSMSSCLIMVSQRLSCAHNEEVGSDPGISDLRVGGGLLVGVRLGERLDGQAGSKDRAQPSGERPARVSDRERPVPVSCHASKRRFAGTSHQVTGCAFPLPGSAYERSG
jgi:hypothetical protein